MMHVHQWVRRLPLIMGNQAQPVKMGRLPRVQDPDRQRLRFVTIGEIFFSWDYLQNYYLFNRLTSKLHITGPLWGESSLLWHVDSLHRAKNVESVSMAWYLHTLVRNDVIGASPVGTAPTTSSFSTKHLATMDWAQITERRDEKHLSSGIRCTLY